MTRCDARDALALSIMRTTVSIHDELLDAAKARARERGLTPGELQELLDEGPPFEKLR